MPDLRGLLALEKELRDSKGFQGKKTGSMKGLALRTLNRLALRTLNSSLESFSTMEQGLQNSQRKLLMN